MARKPAFVDTQNFGLDDLFFVDKVTMKKKFPIHRHSFAEMQYFISGHGTEIINGIAYQIQPGSFSLKLPWHAHEIRPNEGETLEIYKCSFRMSALEEGGMLQSVSSVLAQNYDFRPMEQLSEKDALRVQEIFTHMTEENMVSRTMQDEMIAAQMVQLLICFIRNMTLSDEADSEKSQKLVVQKAMRLLNLRYREEDLSCAQIAKAVNYSEVQVARLLKTEMGMNFSELLREIRIRNACVLLRNTEYPAEIIGNWVGYRSRAGFYNAFSEQKGLTPKEYRKEHASGQDESGPVKVMATSRVLTQIIYYIHKHYPEPLSQEQAAKVFHYSAAYLERLLAENGTSFAELVQDIRIYHAKQELLLSEQSIQKIAEQTGFTSPETFYRVFKKQTGFSPNAYRKHVLHAEEEKLPG